MSRSGTALTFLPTAVCTLSLGARKSKYLFKLWDAFQKYFPEKDKYQLNIIAGM